MVVQTVQFYQDVRAFRNPQSRTSPQIKNLFCFILARIIYHVQVFIVLLRFSDVIIEQNAFTVRLVTIWV